MTGPIRVLHVEDEPPLQELLTNYFNTASIEVSVETAANGKEALQIHEEDAFDCIISDHQMSEMTGIELFERLQERGTTTPFIFYTASIYVQEEIEISATKPPAEIITKGANKLSDVVDTVEDITLATA